MIITNNEIDWLNQNYPGLAIEDISKSSILIRGNFKFKAAYNKLSGKYIINPDNNYYSHPVIEDIYSIEIFSLLDLNTFPIIKNIDGRLLNLAKKLQLDSRDLHVYSGPIPEKNSLCVVGPIDIERIRGDITLRILLENILLPFFYDSSHYEKYGLKPREDYSHGVWGVLENYYDIATNSINSDKECLDKLMKHKEWLIIKKYLIGKNKPKGHHLCVVCMTDKIRKCHRKVFRALFKLHERIKAFNLNNYLQNNSSGTASDNFILNKLRISDKSNV